MPRIDNYDLYDYTYNHNSKLYTFIFIIIAGLIIYFGILGLFNSRNKSNYIRNSVSEILSIIFGSIILTILGLYHWFINFLKFIFGFDNNNKEFAFIIWLYRIIFIGGIIMFFVRILNK